MRKTRLEQLHHVAVRVPEHTRGIDVDEHVAGREDAIDRGRAARSDAPDLQQSAAAGLTPRRVRGRGLTARGFAAAAHDGEAEAAGTLDQRRAHRTTLQIVGVGREGGRMHALWRGAYEERQLSTYARFFKESWISNN